MSLDDFRTLRHLLDYMLPRVGGGAGGRPQSAPATVETATSSVSRGPVAGNVAAPAVAPSRADDHAAGTSAGELETFLVDFVVEQTGYPREIVELDADLEGDLGIDSIRKAQLFGEIGQKYGL